MPNNKDQKSGSKSSMGNQSDREFENQIQNPGSEKFGGKKAGGSKLDHDDDDMSTAGGREGQFSDKNRDNAGQWSPGSSQSSDQ